MRIAYFDCSSGISGDMTVAALIDAGVDQQKIVAAIDSLGLADCRLRVDTVRRAGFRALQVQVEAKSERVHRHLRDIVAIIDRSALSQSQKELACRIFRRLAEAEAKVHGTDIERVHFHEVGAVDSIVDVVGAAVGLDLLAAGRITASPVPTGRGQIRIAHGTVTVPAPGTAELLRGVPLCDVPVEAELTTPTGAAILTSVVEAFGPMPEMTIESIGYGAGSRDLKEQPNVLRVFVGRADAEPTADRVWVLQTNLDDVGGEIVGHCIGRLWEAGALDVYTMPVQMKKDRPGVVLNVLSAERDISRLESIIFQETGTLGIRRWPVWRHKLRRAAHEVSTPWGPITGKIGWLPEGPPCFSPEYESCRQVAVDHGVTLREVYWAAVRAFEPPASEDS